MKKIAIILLVLSTQIVGMEQDNTSWFSWFRSKPKKINIVPEKIALLRKEKAALEKRLSVGRQAEMSMWLAPMTTQLFGGALKNPKDFLQYLYYWKRHENEMGFCINDFYKNENQDALTIMQNYTLDGCSALGAAVIAKDILIREKRKIIKTLFRLNLQPTTKDLNLAYLDLWERTEEDDDRKFLLCLGNNDPNCILSQLPREIIKIIAQFVADEDSLLPRKFFENGIIKMQSNEE